MNFTVEKMEAQDWEAVRAIYQEGIATGNATFETNIPNWKEWDKNHLAACRLVARKEKEVIGWAAASPVSGRCIYSGVAQVSVYVTAAAQGQGAGKALLQSLIKESQNAGIWTLQAGIFPENVASIALHQTCGFRQVGRREGLGQMAGVWRDVILLERRSKIVGI